MFTADIEARLSAFILDNLLLGKAMDLRPIESFLDAGIIDSTGVLELVQFIEETFELHVGDAEILPENLDSLVALTRYVERKRAEQASSEVEAAE